VTLRGNEASITYGPFNLAGGARWSLVSGGTCTLSGGSLAPHQSCTVNVWFNPHVAGWHTAGLDTRVNGDIVMLSIYGLGQ
jgi:hypothetical protein